MNGRLKTCRGCGAIVAASQPPVVRSGLGVKAFARGGHLFVGDIVVVVHHLVDDAVWRQFYYAVAHCPYFFAKGVVCIFDGDTGTNFSLYKNLRKLDAYGYRKVLYCNENIIVANGGKTIRE